MPHATQCLVNIFHDLGWRIAPTQLEQLLPNMACIAVNDSLWDSTEKFMDHDSLVILRNDIERLLNDVAAESIHAQAQGIATDRIGNRDNLFRCAMLEAALDQEVAESIDH